MTFDMSISLGHVVTLLGFFLGGFGFVWTMKGELRVHAAYLKSLGERIVDVESEIKKIAEVLVVLGRQDERMNAMQRQIDDLRHGHGFVFENGEQFARRKS